MASQNAGVLNGQRASEINEEMLKLEDQWNGLSDRHDAAAFKQRTVIADQLDFLRTARAKESRLQEESNERQALIAELTDIYQRVASEFNGALETLTNTAGVPEAVDVGNLYVLGRHLDALRVVIFAATQERAFARPIDALGRLHFAWHQQHLARMRMLQRVRTRNLRPQVPRQPWDVHVSRLHDLIQTTMENQR